MHKLSHLNVNICPNRIFSLPSGGEAHYPFPSGFLACHTTGKRPVPALLEVFHMLEGRAVLQPSDPEAPPCLDTRLPCFLASGGKREALGGRKGNSPGERALTAENTQVPHNRKEGTTGVVPKLHWEQGWKDWAVTHSLSCQMMQVGGTNWKVMSYLETHLAHNKWLSYSPSQGSCYNSSLIWLTAPLSLLI